MRVCTRCVMNDENDKTIRFDSDGHCNYCSEQLAKINTTTYFPNEMGEQKLEQALKEIKEAGKGKKYDCMMGISGGLDSSYLAYLGAKKWGLRILAVHIDDGFDTEISKENVRKLVEKTGIEFVTIAPDAEQFNDLCKAYLLAGVPNIAIPQDNILFAFIYDFARKNNIQYFLSGGNFALESILQKWNSHDAYDLVNIKDIHKKFGTKSMDKMKFISPYRKYMENKMNKLATVRLLNYIDYNRDRAYAELKEYCGFEYYGGKHLENAFTAFAQLYWLPKKFGFDKRTSHLSSMIVSGQMTREEALEDLKQPLYDEALMEHYIDEVKRTLKISDEEFTEIMNAPTHLHTDYKVDKLKMRINSIRNK